MPSASARSRVVAPQADFKRLDVPLGPAHVPLRRVIGIDPAIKDRPLPLRARWQPHRQLVAQPDAVDVSLLNVRPHPEIVLD